MARSNVVFSTLLIHIHDPNEVTGYAQSTVKSRLGKKTFLVQDRAPFPLISVIVNDILSSFLNINIVDLYPYY